ncbi:hypothetical protein H6P81_002618 [Aristolochia fimbriata]|uniref:Protein LURP-one-related 6 n=1 Tax=Aristolochia fimbriata TaxID=158543 RepID=A0AAV7FD43_ARIFI|nr:hypothetical protein H6P81_002618 [Aristolochia fimbriata]
MSGGTSVAVVVPIVSKIYCNSSSPLVFVVRNRPPAVNGGGFVVSNCRQEVVFRVDGCGTLGTKGKLILRDANAAPLLVIRRKGGVVQALSVYKQWRGYAQEEGAETLVFSLKEPSSWALKSKIRVSIGPHCSGWDFEVKGSFVDRDCCIRDRRGNVAAQVGVVQVMKESEESNKDYVYHVVVQPGVDQAFVFGVLAVLDNIYGQSTAC